jgi:pyruvate, water dikinase
MGPSLSTSTIRHLEDLRRDDAPTVGTKAANLGELASIGVPVPRGFVVSATAYLDAMHAAGIDRRLTELSAPPDVIDADASADIASAMRELVHAVGIPQDLRREILQAYRALGPYAVVAVRSSVIPTQPGSEPAGERNATYTNVIGERQLIARISDCWTSLWSGQMVLRHATEPSRPEAAVAVVVQELVDADISGVLFTKWDVPGHPGARLVRASFGLGESVAKGIVEPDTYVVSEQGQVLDVELGTKDSEVLMDPLKGRGTHVDLGCVQSRARVLGNHMIAELTTLGARIERHFGAPQVIEFAVDEAATWVLQSSPISMPRAAAPGDGPRVGAGARRLLVLPGQGAARGTVTGRVRVLRSPTQRSQLLADEILVVPQTNPDWIPTIERATAIVTDRGGIDSHAAIAGRELRIPVVVGTGHASELLHDGEVVSVDGTNGTVRRLKCR